MKPIFGFDITEDKNNDKSYAELFKSKSLSEDTASELEQKRDSLETTINKSRLPIIPRVIMWVGAFYVLMVFGAFLKADISFNEAMRNAPIMFICGFVALIVSSVIFIIGRHKKNKVLEEDNADEKIKDLDGVSDRAFSELGVPANAIPTDILVFRYTVKDGSPKPKTGAFDSTPYLNFEMQAYLSNYNLCLADVENVYSFPLESLRRITTVKKRYIVPSWNKEEKYNKGIYKQYKIGLNQYGYSCKPYYILELEKDGETYGIYFPCYELPTFEALTLLHAEDHDVKEVKE